MQKVRRLRYPLTKIKESDICAEIGVWRGNFAAEILVKSPRELHLVDPWVHQDYKNRLYSIEQQKMDRIYARVAQRFRDDDRVTIHRDFSTSVDFPAQYFDWVYVDANHSYEAALADLNHYYPRIKSGGYLCGDDYGHTDVNCARGPKPAVDEFVAKYGLRLEIHQKNQFVIWV